MFKELKDPRGSSTGSRGVSERQAGANPGSAPQEGKKRSGIPALLKATRSACSVRLDCAVTAHGKELYHCPWTPQLGPPSISGGVDWPIRLSQGSQNAYGPLSSHPHSASMALPSDTPS